MICFRQPVWQKRKCQGCRLCLHSANFEGFSLQQNDWTGCRLLRHRCVTALADSPEAKNNQTPAKTLTIDPKGKISQKIEGAVYFLCSYPNYPKYVSGLVYQASTYIGAKNKHKR